MLDAIRNLFGLESTNYAQLVKNGAIILDVRSRSEYSRGHIRGAVNIPLDELGNGLLRLRDQNKPVITCCASGMRSASARSFLKSNGINEVYNGGNWESLQSKI